MTILPGLRVAVQGLGNVGYHLCRMLHSDRRARLVVSDLNANSVNRAVEEFGATAVSTDEILFINADILAPCAWGGVVDDRSIDKIRARIIAGAANNQL